MTEEPEQPVRWTDINGVSHSTPPGTWRTFSMNSPEFYEAVTCPSILGSCLPRQGGTYMPPVVPGVEWA